MEPNYNLKMELKTGLLIGTELKNFKIENIDKERIKIEKLKKIKRKYNILNKKENIYFKEKIN